MGHVLKYLGHQITDPIGLSINPFSQKNWQREAGDAFNTDPGDIVRDNAGDQAADTLNSTVGAVLPAIAGVVGSAFGTPAFGAALSGATRAGFNYGHGASLGSSLKDGAITGATSYAGQQLGNLASAGSSAGALGGGVGGSGSAYGGDIVGSYGDITDSGLAGLGSNIGSTSSALGDTASAIGDTAGNIGAYSGEGLGNLTSNIGSNVASNSGSLLGDFAKYGKIASPIISAGLGTYTNLAAKNDLLDAANKNNNLLTPFLNQQFTPGDLTQEPGYQFQLQQGNQALDRQQAAKGNYFSGAALKDAQSFGQGLAGTTYNDAFQRFLANQGQKLSAAGGLVSNNNAVGNANANSITGLGNLLGSSAGSLLGGSAYGNNGQLLGQSGGNDSILKLLGLA